MRKIKLKSIGYKFVCLSEKVNKGKSKNPINETEQISKDIEKKCDDIINNCDNILYHCNHILELLNV